MKTTFARLLPLLFAGVVGAAVGWSVRCAVASSAETRAKVAEAQVLSVERQHAATEALTLVQRQLAEAKAKLAAMETREHEEASRREAKQQAKVAAKESERATTIAGRLEKAGVATNDPDAMRRQSEQARLQVNGRYAALFEGLALDPEKREQLIKLLIDKRQAAADVAAMRAEGADPKADPTTYVDMIAANRDDLEQQIHALLGDTDYSAYQAFNQGNGQANLIGQLNQLLATISQPLTAEQTSRLQASLQGNSTGRLTGKVVKDATNYLTAAQVVILRDLRAIQLSNSKKRTTVATSLPTGP